MPREPETVDREAREWYREQEGSLEHLAQLVEHAQGPSPRHAQHVCGGIPIYDGEASRRWIAEADRCRELQSEWVAVLRDGAGAIVLRQAFADTAPIDEATAVFESIIRDERSGGAGGADHFAKPGANDRIWNAQEKLCLRAPEVFLRYFANPLLMAVCEAWLGPAYQMTSQVNVVRPGGEAQLAHCDYHLGFQTVEQALRYPLHVHRMSAFLTLQGAVAHVDMPIESGPTKLLPFSQRFAQGYLAWRRPEMRDYFEAHFVQLPLHKGDALFFNPALFHAAGANRTAEVSRMANLLQVSSAFGRAMEVLDRRRMCEAVYPALRGARDAGGLSEAGLDAVIAACAEGYAFPTHLDRDPPLQGLAPASQQDLLRQALEQNWSGTELARALSEHARRRATD
ncbi:MAG: phytanoyl-CoA dioxygenase family protein [Betaproteobacteria bacterium]|nr:phytanoyl-CoA dioxygenase family protein [Betaproteobacteria bacterium]MBU6512029.1 phytanoyl-CoA dioxygenase family protein [Betaproteobacteria bacterium]MDE1954788.1 phytanoyl-CoA dioxygenase family protein [Betaproteobacteria bacterium]MDE2152218.1 phytanoyl-CoA dioxygenase family protein [Betaproteobacteria bacterium]MDE2477579.1 phytanoyl-CoA dioxygenase family protein [Betaproteobacteria bacterium]